jgi:hypothetical protein
MSQGGWNVLAILRIEKNMIKHINIDTILVIFNLKILRNYFV